MMAPRSRTFSLRYGTGVHSIELPSAWNVFMPAIVEHQSQQFGHELIFEALERPIGAQTLRETAKGKKIVVLVPDKTRKAAVDIVLPILLAELTAAGVPDQKICIVFATGTHPPQTQNEQKSLLGNEVFRKYRIYEHNARDNDACVLVGTTKYGTPVFLHRIVAEAELVLVAGTVVHHYFAGFGGGPKMFFPGVASYESAAANHRRALTAEGNFHPNCRDGNLTGNPVAEDIFDSVQYFPPSWYFATIMDGNGNIAAAVCGGLLQAHAAACSIVDELYSVIIPTRFPVVIASAGGYPKDINLIQTHKALHHAAYAVEDGGTLICLAECSEGIGNESFLQWFEYSCDKDFRTAVLRHYSMNAHTAVAMKEKTSRLKIIMISALNTEVLDKMGIGKSCNISEALAGISDLSNENRNVCVLNNASLYVPRLL